MITATLLALLLLTALAILFTHNLFATTMLMAAFSLLSALLFSILDAPDVAFTEAAVGAGVSTILILEALSITHTSRTSRSHHEPPSPTRFTLTIIIGIATTIFLSLGASDLPPFASPDAPIHTTLPYLERTANDTGITNVVTAILASYRGFDTLGEVFVIFTAAVAVLALLGLPRHPSSATPANLLPVPRVVARLLLPFIILFAFYVQFHGETSPGGGFQAGTIFTAAVVLVAMVAGQRAAQYAFPPKILSPTLAIGVLLYALTGFVCILAGSNFLDYDAFAPPPTGQHIGIFIVELGVGLGVAASLSLLFLTFAYRHAR